ncbi:16S rRNA (guanine(966)-N(2))-methyltransferase RsmD [Hazenella coriacea]|uniref:16S rRNA (Guanine(966)-N(2))-methyltransferase RsmD n=1 Tax=Hazenella coriacea TaxID=1179467 RepID=A0A4R3L177_9BACL|nr:16S rRNA (guanine(966)-N(2))-methyltransferase RsmD [Hazenella coriacea]TCS93099.1 16S rRNA (guanine(966)-N(2))-methyltransferase RsmD [Hazenella coriacea]
MRIIAGTARGTKLKMVPGKHVRPTADRVKESLFQVIGPRFDGDNILDLFAGSGALALEALSRGANQAILVDQSKSSIETIRVNVAATKMSNQVEIIRRDARAAIHLLKKKGLQFDIIFLDPPYLENLLIPVIQSIVKEELLKEEGLVVAEYPSREQLPEKFGALVETRRLDYGDTTISLYRIEK